MAYSNTNAALRGDINTFVKEASPEDADFIGDKVMPIFNSDVESGQYPIFRVGSGDLMKSDVTTRERAAGYGRLARVWESDNYKCVDRGLEEVIDDTDQKNLSRFFDLEVETAIIVKTNVMTGYEIRVAAKIFDPSAFNTTAAATAYTEANIATASFLVDVLNAIDRLRKKGIRANTIVMSPNVWTRVRRMTLLQNFLRGKPSTDTTLNVTQDQVAAALGVDQILVGNAGYDTAKKGQTASLSFVWSDTYVWVGKVTTGSFRSGGAGRTMVWVQEGGLWVTETYRDERIRSDIVRVRHNTAEKIVNSQAGELITTSYS